MRLRSSCTLLLILATGAAAQTPDPDLVWMRGGGGSNDAAWAPDGATFAFATEDGTIQVFDGETRFLVQTIPGHGAPLSGVDYAPDGQRIAAYGEDDAVGVWDRTTGEAVWTAQVATTIFGIDFSADGAVVAAGHRQGVSLFDAATGTPLQTLQTPEGVSDVAFSPDGQYLAAGALTPYFDRQIFLWRATDWSFVRTLTNGPGYPDLAFSPDGSMLAAAGEFDNLFSIRAEIRLWDMASGQLVRTINVGNTVEGASDPGFSPDGQLVFAGHYSLGVNVYEVATGARVSRVQNVEGIRVSPDGQTFLGEADWCGSEFTWASFSFPDGTLLEEFVTHGGAVYNLDVSGDGTMIATGDGAAARVWDAASAERLHEFPFSCTGNTLRDVAFSPDQATLAGGGLCWECEIRLWDVDTGQEAVLPLGHRSFVETIAFSSDGGEIASGSTYVQSLVVSVPEGSLAHAITTGAVHDLAYSDDGALLAFAEWSSDIEIADAVTGADIRTISGAHADDVRRVVFTLDRTLLLSSGDDGLVKVWDVATGALVRTLDGHEGPVTALAVSPDGRHVLTGGDEPAKLWGLATGALLHTYGEETARMMDAKFFPDGAAFAFARWDALGVAHNAAAQAAVAVSAEPVGGPVVIPPGGGSFQFTVTLTNTTAQPQTFQAWTEVSGPVSREPIVGPQTVTLPPGRTVTRTLTQAVPANAPAGRYTYTVNVGDYPGVVASSASFGLTKQGAALAGSGASSNASAEGWLASGLEGLGVGTASSTTALPEGFALSAVYPNPTNGGARLTLALPTAERVTVAVFDALGRRVALLHDGALEAGTHVLAFDASTLAPGVYVVRATAAAGHSAVGRVSVLR